MSSIEDDTPLEVIFDSVGVVIITISEQGIITSANAAASQLFGFTNDDMIGQNVSMLMPEPYRGEHDSYLQNYLQTGVKKIIGIGRRVTGLHKNGLKFPMHLSVAEHRLSGEKGFTGIVQDLSALDQAHTVNARLGEILDDSINEIYVFDIKTLGFTMVNRGARNNLGYTIAEMRNMTPCDLKPYDESGFRSLIEPLLTGELASLHFYTTHKRKDRTFYDVEIVLHLSDVVDPHECVAIVQDVTEKNRIMDALHRSQKMESVGNLTGGIAHDFNNLLAVISGNLELLDMKLDRDSDRELLCEAQEATRMGVRLTKRLLAFARRSTLSPTQVNLNDLILSLTDMLRRTLGETITLDTNLSPELWRSKVDISQLENAIVNLALNARDAMSDGGNLLIETSNYSIDEVSISEILLPAGDYVKVDVTDNGCGIPPEIEQEIFEPFVSSKAESHGTGLGLSMVYGFSRQSGGDVRVHTELNVGTTFSIYLPRSDQPDKSHDPIAGDETANPDVSSVSEQTILVVEDEERVRKLTTRRLQHLGYQVIECVDGYEALSIYKARRHDIDLVFTDIVMTQGMSGYDLAQAIRSIDTSARILLTSGYADDVVNAEKLAESGLRVLRKPYRQAELVEELATAFMSA